MRFSCEPVFLLFEQHGSFLQQALSACYVGWVNGWLGPCSWGNRCGGCGKSTNVTCDASLLEEAWSHRRCWRLTCRPVVYSLDLMISLCLCEYQLTRQSAIQTIFVLSFQICNSPWYINAENFLTWFNCDTFWIILVAGQQPSSLSFMNTKNDHC